MDPLAERLRAERERQGRTLRELSAETKIREPFLEALENGRYDVLPAVYVRSFIRTAGAALQIPSKEIVRLMNEVFDVDDEDSGSRLPSSQQPLPPKPPVKPPAKIQGTIPGKSPLRMPSLHKAAWLGNLFNSSTGLRSPLSIAMIIIACIGIIVFIWAIFLRDASEASQTNPSNADSVLDVDASQAVGVGGSGQGSIAATDSIILTAESRDSAWLNITSDDKRTQQVVIVPGGEYKWSAMQRFVLSVSNAGAVTFSRNGEQLKPFGKNGEAVRSVVITRKDVKTSSSVVRPPTKPVPAAPRPQITPVPQQRVDPNKRTKPEAVPRR